MKFISSILISLLLLTSTQAKNDEKTQPENYPTATLKNDSLEVTILLPDINEGFYRGARFDWSGIIAQVTYDKHTYFTGWNESLETGKKHDPTDPAAATGTAEEFRNPLGYEEAIGGGKFVKIGVGVLERNTNKAYHWDYSYPIIKPGTWEIKHLNDRISFLQNLTTDFGYAYQYTKTIILHQNSTKITVSHSLKNTGIKPFETNPYCHIFFKFDDYYIGKNHTLSFSDTIYAKSDFGANARFNYNSIDIINELSDTSVIKGIIDINNAKTFTLSNSKTSTSVTVNYDVLP